MAADFVIEDLTVLFSFRGRIRRATFWDGWAASTLICLLIGALLLALSAAGFTATQLWLVGGLLACLPLWVWLAVCAKRWHDLGWSTAMLLLNILPLAALAIVRHHPLAAAWAGGGLDTVLILYLGLAKGTRAPNQFGASAL